MKLKKVVLTFAAGLALQAGIYYYLDNVLFAATSDYQIDGTNKQEAMGFGVEPDGQAYYSFDKRFMATVVGDTVTIYQAGKKGESQKNQFARSQTVFLRMVARSGFGDFRHIWTR